MVVLKVSWCGIVDGWEPLAGGGADDGLVEGRAEADVPRLAPARCRRIRVVAAHGPRAVRLEGKIHRVDPKFAS